MTAKNQIELDYSDNPELAELFANKEIGDTCKLTITLQINRKDGSSATGTVKEVEGLPHDDEDSEDETDDETMNDQPVMVMMGGGKSKSKSESY